MLQFTFNDARHDGRGWEGSSYRKQSPKLLWWQTQWDHTSFHLQTCPWAWIYKYQILWHHVAKLRFWKNKNFLLANCISKTTIIARCDRDRTLPRLVKVQIRPISQKMCEIYLFGGITYSNCLFPSRQKQQRTNSSL